MNEANETSIEPNPEELSLNKRIRQTAWLVVSVFVVFLLGVGSGYLKWAREENTPAQVASLYQQINPVDGYDLSVPYGDLGPQLLQSGVIDYEAFAKLYQNAGKPLSVEQIEILKNGSDQEIVINAQNAHFLLNFFWAVGLANKNSILTQGPMVQQSNGEFERFASTGGWGLATKPVKDLYASLDLIPLTADQQRLVEQVTMQVYRPCCNNPTYFPDCNHGMAMLGILELMASEGATADEMFQAAKYINAYWFPQQTLETAIFLKANQDTDFADANPELVVGQQLFSASGSQMVHADLQSKGLLQPAPGQGGSCAN